MTRVPKYPGKGAEAFLHGTLIPALPRGLEDRFSKTLFPTRVAFATNLRPPEQLTSAITPIADLRRHERNRLPAFFAVMQIAGA